MIASLTCLFYLIFYSHPIISGEARWLPLNGSLKQLTPKKHRYPHLYSGSHRIFFFLKGEEMAGLMSKKLSTACVIGNFNQKRKQRYYVMVDMPNGRKKKFGFVDSGGKNLYDPNNRTGPKQAYMFENDGTSECKVYVAVTER